ncbi:glycosyltransferase [Streptomyces sp. BG9H]|uniref:Glycosyltransferase n=1 Tax=Streptomyces anatolicus TaxID=2675858 RepID=A0ABS6YKV0_9ACTN|nr:glycosyltransferase [Streptomyces anatolicus]
MGQADPAASPGSGGHVSDHPSPPAHASHRIRVASVPAGHVYVRHCSIPESDGVIRLRDPRPNGAPSTSQRWWPPVMLDPAWVSEHHEDFDVFHLHFGFDAQSPAQLSALAEALRRHGKPFVYTVHDLRNPHQPDPAIHDAALDVLVPAADRLITLTPGAARVIDDRWGRTAVVLPHPHVVELPRLGQARPHRDRFRIGVHAKSLRPNMSVLPVVRVLAEAAAELPGAELQVNLHHDVADVSSPAHAPALVNELRDLADRGRLTLQVHDYFDDDQLWDYLTSLDLSVLPYLFGTHSGWLEACHDLGTAVAAPDCGFYAQQRPCLTYGHTQDGGLDEESLRKAVLTAFDERPAPRATVRRRAQERADLAAAHYALYDDVLREASCG